jgi:signal transduction histidine kinase/CheY-like chemotaxis protein/HPt (histidine-containing phosphotransfer) domain-containing protein
MEELRKKYKKVIILFSLVIWLLLTALCIFTALNGDKFMIGSETEVYLTLYCAPFLLLGALYGYYFGMVSFIISFFFVLHYAGTAAYNMSVFLLATICFSLFSQYFFFKTIKGTLIAAAGTTLMTGFVEYVCVSLVQQGHYKIGDLWEWGSYMAKSSVCMFGMAFVVYLFMNKAPDIIKAAFALGIAYTKAYERNKDLQRSIRKTKVSIKITAIIIGTELLLGVAVSVFTIVLFPDLKQMFVEGVERHDAPHTYTEQLDESSAEGEEPVDDLQGTDDLVSRINDMDYRFDSVAIGFDIKMILLVMCVGVPLAAIANFYTKSYIATPIGIMSDFMYEYAGADDEKKLEVGKKIDRIHIRSHDEIRVLYESMKTTVHSVEDYITRMAAEQELEKELEVAKKASEAKSSFLSNMSHEIRTPINAVLGMNEMIIRESSECQIIEYANNVKSAGNSLLGIVNDILDFSKIEAGKMDILPVEYNLGSTINDLINMVAVKAEDKGLELKLDIDEKLPSKLIGDEIRIKQCVTNILTNAVKYTEAGSVLLSIYFSKLDDENIMLGFRVVDTGIGIKEEDLNKLYSPFERIEEIRNRSIEGTGLGMSIVKKLLALMDTKLQVKSVYGEGSDFYFEVKQQVVSWEEIGDYKKRYKEYIMSLERYHEKFRAPDARILVVDDTPINLTVVKGLLKKTLINVDTAESGFETLDKVKEKKYDAIFIDHRMPEMDGIETLAALKLLADNKSIDAPCIALTANAGSGAREEYMAAGFDDYLSKPVNGDELEDMLKNCLPKEKILFAPPDDDSEQGAADKVPDSTDDILKDLDGVDYELALKNCGSREVLFDVIKEFYISIPSKSDSIEKYFNDRDYRNYTVAVHALKSSARLIGAAKLSDLAAFLEKCGDEANEKEINDRTPELLSLYRSYIKNLSPIAEEKDDDDKPEIPEADLKQAFSDLRELLEAYDFDTADGIMKMLSEYRISAEYKDKYNRVKELMAAVDRDGLLELL